MTFSFVRRAAVLATLVFAASSVQAQTVDEIVAKNIQAKGGYELLKNTTSVRTTGSGTMQGSEVTITTISKRPYFVRNEMGLAGQKMVVGFDGTTAWMAAAGLPPQPLPAGPQTDVLKQNSQIDSPLFDYKAKGTKVELGEPLTEAGRKLHHLIVTPKGSPAMHYYLDATTGLEAKMVIDTEDSGQQIKMEMRFSDFKAVDGRMVPFNVTQFVNGNQVVEMKFQKIEFNVPVDEAIFKMPAK
jgi:outer membrane lipoprotein-sorting protein